MEDGKVFYSFVESACVIKMVGAMLYKSCQDLNRFLDKVMEDPKINEFVVDLSETTYINSTNLGLISKLYELSIRKKGPRPLIVSTRENINEILLDIGFANIFDIIHDVNLENAQFDTIPETEKSQEKLGRIMLDSHRALSKLNLKNKEQFKDVIKFLEQDLNKE